MAELQTRQPIDTEAMRALIAKVKKVYAENAEAIEAVERKGLMVRNGQLRFG